MTRVKRGVLNKKKRSKTLKYTKGFGWRRKTHERAAKEALLHAWTNAFRGRKQKKRDYRTLWTSKINSEVRNENLTYSKFINALKKKGIKIDLTQRPRAEEDPVVAAASIMARAAFVDGIDALGKEIGMTLPKGANSHVIDAGRKLVQQQGRAILEKVAKLHFKTTQQILS